MAYQNRKLLLETLGKLLEPGSLGVRAKVRNTGSAQQLSGISRSVPLALPTGRAIRTKRKPREDCWV